MSDQDLNSNDGKLNYNARQSNQAWVYGGGQQRQAVYQPRESHQRRRARRNIQSSSKSRQSEKRGQGGSSASSEDAYSSGGQNSSDPDFSDDGGGVRSGTPARTKKLQSDYYFREAAANGAEIGSYTPERNILWTPGTTRSHQQSLRAHGAYAPMSPSSSPMGRYGMMPHTSPGRYSNSPSRILYHSEMTERQRLHYALQMQLHEQFQRQSSAGMLGRSPKPDLSGLALPQISPNQHQSPMRIMSPKILSNRGLEAVIEEPVTLKSTSKRKYLKEQAAPKMVEKVAPSEQDKDFFSPPSDNPPVSSSSPPPPPPAAGEHTKEYLKDSDDPTPLVGNRKIIPSANKKKHLRYLSGDSEAAKFWLNLGNEQPQKQQERSGLQLHGTSIELPKEYLDEDEIEDEQDEGCTLEREVVNDAPRSISTNRTTLAVRNKSKANSIDENDITVSDIRSNQLCSSPPLMQHRLAVSPCNDIFSNDKEHLPLLNAFHHRQQNNQNASRIRSSSGESQASSKDSSIFSWISGKFSHLSSSVVGEHFVNRNDQDQEGTDSYESGQSKESKHSISPNHIDEDLVEGKQSAYEPDHDDEQNHVTHQSDGFHEDEEIRSSDDENHEKKLSEPIYHSEDASYSDTDDSNRSSPHRTARNLHDSDLQYSPASTPDNFLRQVRFNSPRKNSPFIDGVVDPNTPMLSVRNDSVRSKLSQMRRTLSKGKLAQLYAPIDIGAQDDKYGQEQYHKCPRCGALQREFFGVNNAPTQFDSPAGYLALYFGIYVVASFFLFGIEEGWKPLDCVYFAVITLTTTGLGDLHPTSPQAKMICSIFIYFGVACIGLLLGSLLASSLDDESRRVAKEQLADNCLNCQRLGLIHDHKHTHTGGIPRHSGRGYGLSHHSSMRQDSNSPDTETSPIRIGNKSFFSERFSFSKGLFGTFSNSEYNKSDSSSPDDSGESVGSSPREKHFETYDSVRSDTDPDTDENLFYDEETPMLATGAQNSHFNISRSSRTTLNKTHTRHYSIDATNYSAVPFPSSTGTNVPQSIRSRNFSYDVGSRTPSNAQTGPRSYEHLSFSRRDTGNSDFYEASSASSSEDTWEDPLKPLDSFAAARHVFLTLKQAVMNSLLIILVGSIGFYYIEKLTAVDAFYFTTVLLTTVGYGDIVPVTDEGKVFATVYVLVAGTILLHNMSMISMIPLELRKRRIERAVLMQFGEHLDDAALRELATGPLTQRLQLAADRSDGLNECTREMFALAMLVRLGRISERDVKATFGAFRRLDRDNDGKLSSKDIICGMFDKVRSSHQARSLNQSDHFGSVQYGPSQHYETTVPVGPSSYYADDLHDADAFIQESLASKVPYDASIPIPFMSRTPSYEVRPASYQAETASPGSYRDSVFCARPPVQGYGTYDQYYDGEYEEHSEFYVHGDNYYESQYLSPNSVSKS